MKKFAKHWRQGDVLIVAAKAIPADAALVARDKRGVVVLAEGELTGHSHHIADQHATLKQTAAGRTFLAILDDVAGVRHEEHTRIDLAPGNYRVARQVEYSAEALEALRTVAD